MLVYPLGACLLVECWSTRGVLVYPFGARLLAERTYDVRAGTRAQGPGLGRRWRRDDDAEKIFL